MIVPLDDYRPHVEGAARCRCGREWHATAPLGVTFLECPECHGMAGRFAASLCYKCVRGDHAGHQTKPPFACTVNDDDDDDEDWEACQCPRM